MSARLPWIQRRWTFTAAVGVYPDVIERLRGTPARVEDLVRHWPAAILTCRDGESW